MDARGFAPGRGARALTMVRRVVIPMLRVGVALVFGDAGWIKIQSPQAFADGIATFQLLPVRLNNLLALGLPPFELGLAILLLSGWKTRTMAFCALVACGVFLLALGSAMVRGLPITCGCFGDAPSTLSPAARLWLALGRDVLLVSAVAIVYRDAYRKQ